VFSRAFDSLHCMSNVNVVRNQAGTILSDGINKYIYHFCVVSYGLSSGT
jgi:hypothetical protein